MQVKINVDEDVDMVISDESMEGDFVTVAICSQISEANNGDNVVGEYDISLIELSAAVSAFQCKKSIERANEECTCG